VISNIKIGITKLEMHIKWSKIKITKLEMYLIGRKVKITLSKVPIKQF